MQCRFRFQQILPSCSFVGNNPLWFFEAALSGFLCDLAGRSFMAQYQYFALSTTPAELSLSKVYTMSPFAYSFSLSHWPRRETFQYGRKLCMVASCIPLHSAVFGNSFSTGLEVSSFIATFELEWTQSQTLSQNSVAPEHPLPQAPQILLSNLDNIVAVWLYGRRTA